MFFVKHERRLKNIFQNRASLIVNIKNTEVQELSITSLSAYDVLIIDYESTTEVWRYLTVQVSLLVVFMENLREFNVSGQ